MRPTSFEMVRGLVGRGLGYTILVTRPKSDMSYDGQVLVARPLRGDLEPIGIALIKRSDDLAPTHRQFAKIVIDELSKDECS